MIEKKSLKSCLGIPSTPDDLVYFELNKANIVSTIRDRQYNFFRKFMNQNEDSAIAMNIWNLYNNNVDSESEGVIHYFQNLEPMEAKRRTWRLGKKGQIHLN